LSIEEVKEWEGREQIKEGPDDISFDISRCTHLFNIIFIVSFNHKDHAVDVAWEPRFQVDHDIQDNDNKDDFVLPRKPIDQFFGIWFFLTAAHPLCLLLQIDFLLLCDEEVEELDKDVEGDQVENDPEIPEN